MKEIKIRNRVKLLRVEQGTMTQGELAKLIGVTRQSMNLIEAQKYNPTIKICLLISKYLEKPLDEIFWIEDE